MGAFLLFLKRNPRLIIIGVVGVLCVAQIIYILRLENKNKDLKHETVMLENDTLAKGYEIIRLKYDTSFYRRKLQEIKLETKQLKDNDAKQNPGLINKFPDVKDIKNR